MRLLFIAGLTVVTWQALTPTPLPYEPLTSVNDKLGHLLAFLALALLADGGWPAVPFLWRKALPLLLYGAAIEVLQHFIPNRSLSLGDWVADGAGILLYFILIRPYFQPESRGAA